MDLELKKAVKILNNYCKILNKSTNEKSEILMQSIELILNELHKLNMETYNLKSYLAEKSLISDYIKFRKKDKNG